MRILRTVLTASVGLLSAWAAEEAQPRGSTNAVVITTELIDRFVAEVRTNNPALKAADLRVRAATLNAEAVRTWEDPAGVFGGSVYSAKGFKPEEDGNLAYGIEQKLPLWNRPKLTRRVAEAETSVREAEVNYRIQQLRGEITKALLATALAEEEVAVGEQDLAWLEAIAQTAENKYRAGAGSVADPLQAQNEVANRNDLLRTDRNRVADDRFTLNRLLNRDASATWPVLKLPLLVPAIPLSQKLLDLSLRNEPRLKVLEREIKRAAASAELTWKMQLPDVSLGVEGRQFSGDGEFRSGMFTLRFSLPWLNGDKYRKDYQRDKDRQQAALEEREDRVLTVREELHHLAVNIDAARRQALLQGGEIDFRAKEALNSRVAEWETGRGALRDVLDARRMVLESQLTAARATAAEHEMLADMLLWAGLENLETLKLLASEPPLLPDHENDPHSAPLVPLPPPTVFQK